MFEHRSSPLLPRQAFYRRVAICFLLSQVLVAVALGIGMAGYHFIENLAWVDAFENAAMIPSGMGPVATLQTDAGKIFAGCYALFSGRMLITVTGIVLAPVVHRAQHKFHLESGRKPS